MPQKIKRTIIWSRFYVGKPCSKKTPNSLDVAFRDSFSECTTYLCSSTRQLFSLSSFYKRRSTKYNRQNSCHVQGPSQLFNSSFSVPRCNAELQCIMGVLNCISHVCLTGKTSSLLLSIITSSGIMCKNY